MAVSGVSSAYFVYDHPRHKDLPRFVEPNSTIPCIDTSNRFILMVDRGETNVTASMSLEK